MRALLVESAMINISPARNYLAQRKPLQQRPTPSLSRFSIHHLSHALNFFHRRGQPSSESIIFFYLRSVRFSASSLSRRARFPLSLALAGCPLSLSLLLAIPSLSLSLARCPSFSVPGESFLGWSEVPSFFLELNVSRPASILELNVFRLARVTRSCPALCALWRLDVVFC